MSMSERVSINGRKTLADIQELSKSNDTSLRLGKNSGTIDSKINLTFIGSRFGKYNKIL